MQKSLKTFGLFLVFAALQISPARAARQASEIVRFLYDYDHAVPVKVVKGRSEMRGGLRWTHTVFTSVLDQEVTTWLVEKPGQTPAGLVLLQHGNSDSKDNDRLNYIATHMVEELGYTAILTDAMYHGERQSPVIGKWSGKNLMNTPHALRDVFIQTVRDHRRIIDGAASELGLKLPVTYVSESLGSLMGTVLTSVESRITRAVFLVGGADFAKVMPLAVSVKGFATLQQIIDPIYFVGAIKTPVLMLNGKKDMLFGANSVNAMFDGLGSKHKKLVWFDSGHLLPKEEVFAAIKGWLRTPLDQP